MGIINDEPNSLVSDCKEGKRGPPGIGFRLNDNGNYDIENKRLVNVANPTNAQDSVNYMTVKAQTLLLDGSNHMTGYLNMSGNEIINSGNIIMNNKTIKQMGIQLVIKMG